MNSFPRAVKKISALLQFATFAMVAASSSTTVWSQTVSLNDGSILQAKTNRIGMNIGAMDYYDNGQILKNLIGAVNPGMEPLNDQQIWVVGTNGSTTSFTVPDVYDGVPPNYWAGGTFTVVSVQAGGAELGCTGTIASNTGPNYPAAGVTNWVAPVVTVASPCAASFSVGDIVIMSKSIFPTPESWWETSQGGVWGNISNGGQLLSDTTDLCATCGVQSLNLNASANGSSAAANFYFDTSPSVDMFVLMNGTYQLSFWAKAASGSPALSITALRFSSGGFNCGSYSPKLTSTWTQYSFTCTASESQSGTTPGPAQISFQASSGSVYLDNVNFAKTSSDPTNTTVLRDEVIQTLKKFYGPAIGSNPGMFRFWLSQNGENMQNWTQPGYAHAPTSTGTGYFVGPNGAGTTTLSLEDYLVICQLLNAQPYLEVPVTLSSADAANLIEFLASPASTTYGARRAALGQSAPWTSVFSTIHLSFCNECWNGSSFPGQSLAYRPGAPNAPGTGDPEYYFDYSMRTKSIFAAMRADGYYSQSAFDLVMNTQTPVTYTMDAAIKRAQPDSVEIQGYTYSTVSDFGSDSALWGPAFIEPYSRVTNPSDPSNFYNAFHDYQSQNTCGASGTATCKVNIYEWGQGTLAGSIDQTHLDYINAGAGEGVVMALQPLLNLQYFGTLAQSNFALTEFQNSALNGHTAKLWGNVVDMGGATNNVRPAFLAMSLVNQSIIGSMYACPIANNATYNFAGSQNNGNPTMPALNNVPYLYAFCFANGAQRSLVLINTDLGASHALSFSGTNPPIGTVTQRQFAPSSLDALNEAPSSQPSNTTAAAVALSTTNLSSPSSINLPPYSVTALDYTVSTQGIVATPAFSIPGGTYSAAQSVSITDSTGGATIYYTTNGATPGTGSTLYTAGSLIPVGATETLQAIAVLSGYTNSAVASAAYTINLPVAATPTFSITPGTYTGAQSISIGDSTSGATIYYTVNGTTPTTGSTVFTPGSSISVSSTEIIQAIAAASGYTTSPVASAAYTINLPVAATPLFSVPGGTYTTTKSVSITDSTPGTTIYYTTNGNNPTTGSAVYTAGSSIAVNASETLKAIAAASGYTTSPVASAAYTINLPVAATPGFSMAGGTYVGSISVSLSDSTGGTTIYYTTNGSTPGTGSTVYNGSAITVGSSETLQAIAVASGYTNSPVASASYTITAPAAPVFSPAAGTFTSAQQIYLTDATNGATIYYTTNGSTPSTGSTRYTGSFSVGSTTTVNAIAVYSGTSSTVASAVYTINLPSSYLIPNGTYSITNLNSGLALEVPGWSGSQGTVLDQWAGNGGANQRWQLTNLGNNLVKFINQNSGLAIEVSGSSTSNGAAIDQAQYTGANNQIWSVVNEGNGNYELINVNSGLALEVPGWSGSQGTTLDQWSPNAGGNQLWSIK